MLLAIIPRLGLAAQPADFVIADLGQKAPIEIDGVLEPAWDAVPGSDAFEEYRPRQGVAASVRTVVRMARDATHLYVSARLFDPDITHLRRGLARRDNFSNEQDWFALFIDPLGTRRVAQLMYFNPDGVIWDGLANQDAGTSSSAADFEVEVVTRVYSDSWVVELRIPFSELRYASRDPDAWHILLERNYPREERHAMAAPAIPANAPCLMCLAAPAHPGPLPAPRDLSLVPQVVTLSRAADDAAGEREWHAKLTPSLDAKFRLDAATVFDATVNPDFSQVDLDTPQLSTNKQIAVSFPEKRPFFLEGADILESPLPALYTRSIAEPDWGARATHRGEWDGAILTTRDSARGFTVLPGAYGTGFALETTPSQATIGRVRRPVGAFTLGALFSDRRGDGAYNSLAGPDATWRVSPTTRLSAQWLGSRTRGTDGSADAASGSAASLDVEHESAHWRATAVYHDLDAGFRADNGFIPQTGIRQLTSELRRKFSSIAGLSELAPYLTTDDREDRDGLTVSSAPHLGLKTTWPSNLVLITELRPREQVRVRANAALHSFSQGYVALSGYPGAWLPVFNLEATAGEAFDFTRDRVGRGETVSASVLWRPAGRLEIEPRLDFTTVRTDADLSGGAQTARESAAQLLATVHLTARDRFRLIVQRLSVERETGGTHLADQRQLVGSLLFTHERSLARRFYAGISFAHSRSGVAPDNDALELFLKVQTDMEGWRAASPW
jgi:hypothetical protein